jgi:pyruvate/2-oxoglutarate dehydrogenase complex dihydrolipoamide dehydrogenase (E3) component
MGERHFDALVLGAGPAGEVAAGRLADRGLDVAIVERDLIGGECSYYSCMPSKALLRPGELLAETGRVPGVRGEGIDVRAALDRRDEVIHGRDDSGQVEWLEDHEITLFRGAGRLEGERRVRVGEDVLVAERAVILATGSSAALPPVDGLGGDSTWSNREATTAESPPRRLAVLGGGPVGCELAQAWRSLGSEVTLIEGEERLLPPMEPFAGEQVAESLHAAGVQLRLGRHAKEAEENGSGEITLTLDDGAEVVADRVLAATGRRPNSEGIGLEDAGLEPGDYLEVDDRMRVGGRGWLFAIGDLNGRALLTHAGKYQARIAADEICGNGVDATGDGPGVPQIVFTDPQVAAAGLTLERAREAGIDAEIVEVTTSANAGASFHGRGTTGTSRLVIDPARQLIVGATFVGFETAELLHGATIAIVGEVPLERLAHAIPSFPSRSELWLQLLEEYGL